MERLVWIPMLFPGDHPAVFDDVPITAVMTLKSEGAGTRYALTALYRDAADLKNHKENGYSQGTEIAVDQFVAHVMAML